MPKKRFTPEQIIGLLRQAEVELAQGGTVGEVSRALGVSEQSFYRWRNEYGGLKVDPARRLKDPERENARLWLADGSCLRLRPSGPNHVGRMGLQATWRDRESGNA